MKKNQPRRHNLETFARKREEFKTKVNHDLSSEDIGRILDIRPKTIRKWARLEGIVLGPSRRDRAAATKRAAMVGSDYIQDGQATISLLKLGRYFGVCPDTVKNWLIAEGIKPCDNLSPWVGPDGVDARDDLPAEVVWLAQHLESWKRNPQLNEIVWPIIARRRWHESAHHTNEI
jgi:hypothetical protein